MDGWTTEQATMPRSPGRKSGVAARFQAAAEHIAVALYQLGIVVADADPELAALTEQQLRQLARPAAGVEMLARRLAGAGVGQGRLTLA